MIAIPAMPAARVLGLLAAVLLLLGANGRTFAQNFDFETVAKRARELSQSAYKKPESQVPPQLRDIDAEQYARLAYRPEKRAWNETRQPFELSFFHMGRHYDLPVRIHEIVNHKARPFVYSPEQFDFGDRAVDAEQLKGLGYSGFRVHTTLNRKDREDEFLVFHGASYFRAVGKGQWYGLSARGLAIDTAESVGEEFPRFTDFWLQRPAPGAKELTIYALMDSPRATGAYRFIVRPGVSTEMDVSARVYLRAPVLKFAIAPLTSMYFFGQGPSPVANDYRRAVHDSEGLSVRTANGEWLWRPLDNPKKLLVTSFVTESPSGFGLMQRSRGFRDYDDATAHYELRPSAWIEPRTRWGKGRVELVQIPEPDETNDNIVAYWVPAKPPEPGSPFDFSYRLSWQKDRETQPPLWWVARTVQGVGTTRTKNDGGIALAVDFKPPSSFQPDGALPEVDVSSDANGEIIERRIEPLPSIEGWRVSLRLRRKDDKKPVELRAVLRSANQVVSESWNYILPPA